MADVATKYLGLELPSPLVLASSSLSNRVEALEAAEGHGAGAVVLRSLFEEQIESAQTALDLELERGQDTNPEGRTYFPPQRVGPHEYVSLIERAKRALRIPVIASLNCADTGSWSGYARDIERAGADALEVNIYSVEADPALRAEEIEWRHVSIVESIRAAVKIPIAVKLSPYYTSVANMAARMEQAGAQGIVLFNRFLQPDISLEKLAPQLGMNLSTPAETLLPLRWIALLHGRLKADLASSTGIHDAQGAAKHLLAGATVVQLASTLVKNGVPHLGRIRAELEAWMDKRGYSTLDDLRGTLSQRQVTDPAAFERAQYVQLILSQNG
ncbi:MAG TPA: dihydroorotate dehydrogenase-like protein [Anaeromyxobacteraceae bacterium]|nr:dihydroorotate dehydrogenase-like protein [Anaeromyxobacteraceae bacterium]